MSANAASTTARAADPCVRSHAGRGLCAPARDLSRFLLRGCEREPPSLGGSGGGVLPGGGEQMRRRRTSRFEAFLGRRTRRRSGLERAFQLTDRAKHTGGLLAHHAASLWR